MPRQHFWEVKNAVTKGEGELYLYGRIASASSWWSDVITPKQFKKDLDSLGDISVLNVYINSPGGDVFAGQAIYSMLKRHKAHVNVHVDALAASIASVVAQAGDTRYVPANGMMMVHKAWTRVEGNADDLRKMAGDLDKIGETIVAAYEERATIGRDEILALMEAETWLTAEECVAYGFADEITPAKQIAASIEDGVITFSNQTMSVEKMQNVAQLISKLPSASMGPRIDSKKEKKEEKSMNFEELLASLSAEQRSVITNEIQKAMQARDELKIVQDELKTSQAALKAVQDELKTALERVPTSNALTDEAFLASLPEDVRTKYVADQKAAADALAEAKRLQDTAEEAGFVAKAKAFSNIPIQAEEFGKVLMAISKAVPEAFTQVESVLGAVNAAMESNQIFKNLGSAGDQPTGTSLEMLNAKAVAIAARDSITKEQAFLKACRENAELYASYQKELRGEE